MINLQIMLGDGTKPTVIRQKFLALEQNMVVLQLIIVASTDNGIL